ncbi:MAG: glycosyltransferase, partial [Actinobacteria bacterium]|nr:glycosyltransferase [Actinomycetota bacterium]
ELHASFDVFVHAGLSETFCQSIQEALASGVPVVAPASGGPLDLVSEGVNGLFWDPQHPDTLIEKVHMLEAEGELRKVLAGNARGTVVDRTWSSIMEELEDHYRSVVDGARSMGVRGAA